MSIQEINEKYRQICTVLGDIDVKIQGLKNQRKAIYKDLEALDEAARKAGEQGEATPES